MACAYAGTYTDYQRAKAVRSPPPFQANAAAGANAERAQQQTRQCAAGWPPTARRRAAGDPGRGFSEIEAR
jgi:hypothetical protein